MGISLEESTTDSISPVLEKIVESVTPENKVPDSIQKDYLLSLLIVSMIENGFSPVDKDCEILHINSINAQQLIRWKTQTGVYEVPLIMTGFKNTPITLIMSPLGAMALVNVVIKDFEAETYSVCLPMSKYVAAPQATTIPMIFRDLKHFSICLKNKVISAVKSRILDHYGYASASLVGLPDELLFKIMLYLPVADIIRVSKTCMRLRELFESDRIWHDILKRDFMPARDLPSTGLYDWRKLYKSSYSVQREKDLAMRKANNFMNEYMDLTDFPDIDLRMWNAYNNALN